MDLIIDCHTHIGEMYDHLLNQDTILKAEVLDEVTRDCSQVLVSHAGIITKTKDKSKMIKSELANLELLKTCNSYPRFKPVYALNTDVNHFARDILAQNHFYGLKIHPSNLEIPIGEKYIQYLDLAKSFKLPIIMHTASDEFSTLKNLYTLLSKYPKYHIVPIILAHMEIGETIKINFLKLMQMALKDGMNLYVDTSWVDIKYILMAIEMIGCDKILWGTDAPITEFSHYSHYMNKLNNLKNNISVNDASRIFFKNANDLFFVNN